MQVDTAVKRTNCRQILEQQWNEFYEEEHPYVSQDEWLLFMLDMQDTMEQALLDREYEAYDSFEREHLEYQISLMPPDLASTSGLGADDMDTVMT